MKKLLKYLLKHKLLNLKLFSTPKELFPVIVNNNQKRSELLINLFNF